MNIVKGVADLLRRSTGGQGGEGSACVQPDKLTAPTPRVRFRDSGEELVLSTLWQRYENAIVKTEKRKLLQVFLFHFIQTYKCWEPVNNGQPMVGEVAETEDIIAGCTFGHPSEVILVLVQEIDRVTSLISKLSNSSAQVDADGSESLNSFTFNNVETNVLCCLTIITRSICNCKIFSYYGGVQKVTALLKVSVVQLKTLTSSVVGDELSIFTIENIRSMQKILVYVVSIISTFIDLHSLAQVFQHTDAIHNSFMREDLVERFSNRQTHYLSEVQAHWQQKAIVLVMESGGVNWLVELLRMIRRLNLKELWTDLSLQNLTLGCLRSSLSENPRAQNHFKSIGGLEVLLDGLGLPSSKFSAIKSSFPPGDERSKSQIFRIFQLQILSLDVLREAIFGNIGNLQFLLENGRIQKLANSICWPAFMFLDFQNQKINSSFGDLTMSKLESIDEISENKLVADVCIMDRNDASSLGEWNQYTIKLSRGICSFLLLSNKDTKLNLGQSSISQRSLSISVAYWELSVRWIMRVLFTIFPCIKTCASGSDLPDHIRILVNILQHSILRTFKQLLGSEPSLLEVFRKEGVWDFIFSENFFYFGCGLESSSFSFDIHYEEDEVGVPFYEASDVPGKSAEVDILQVEAISFLEFAAQLSGSENNLPEVSVLLDALEQSECNPAVGSIFVRSLVRILQLAAHQTLASFKSLNAIARVLKVACTQSQELRKLNRLQNHSTDDCGTTSEPTNIQSPSLIQSGNYWITCMMNSLELFAEYLSASDDSRNLVLHNTSCIDYLFELIWVEDLHNNVLEHILFLVKLPPSPYEGRAAQVHLCSKYLEIFTIAKEKEKHFADLSIDLLVCLRGILMADQVYYQKLFLDGGCFLHIVSLLNGNHEEGIGETLVLNVLQTLTLLLTGNEESKISFRDLVGAGYQTLLSLLLDFGKWKPTERLLDALVDMLTDGNFEMKHSGLIRNEDAVILFINVTQKCSASLQHYGLEILLNFLRDSVSNRTLCSRAGVVNLLLDWFSLEETDDVISKLAQIIQIVGGHSISGKDIRKIFAILRNHKFGSGNKHILYLISSIQSMLKERGPVAFLECNGLNSGIVIRTTLQWPSTRGFSFSFWLRIESFPDVGMMGLFCFLTDNGRGCCAMLGKEKLIFESINTKRQCVSIPHILLPKRWYFLCITHSLGRAFSGGSFVKFFVDGHLISSEKCRYAKVNDVLTRCMIGTEILLTNEDNQSSNYGQSVPFRGQIGPIYMFNDALSSEQVMGIHCLGPCYMYSFVCEEIPFASDTSLYNSILDAKDGLSMKVIFGLNAQASDGKTLFNVLSMVANFSDKNQIQAVIMNGTQICYRRMLCDVIYCVGGVSVFFPLLTQLDKFGEDSAHNKCILVKSIATDKLAAEVIDLIASVLEENLANQQQMYLLSGFSVLGFLFQSIPPLQLNIDTLSALKKLFSILKNHEVLSRDTISKIFFDPYIWVYASYEVQRDLYMFLIQYFENDKRWLGLFCGLPRIIDIICQFYWDNDDGQFCFGRKPLLHTITKQVVGERPAREEVHKIRLLLLSLAEMSLRQEITTTDLQALIGFFERSQDMACIEDVLQMVIRSLSQKSLLVSFSEKVNILGGCQIFLNLLQREMEPIRLLGLEFVGKLLVGCPSEKKGSKFLSLSVGRSKSVPESYRNGVVVQQTIFSSISDRLFNFPLSDNLCATLFDVLLGGASPKQVLQKHSQSQIDKKKWHNSLAISSHFLLPQTLECIFKFLAICNEDSARKKVLMDLLDLLDSNPSNAEALMEFSWNSWLTTSVRLHVFKEFNVVSNIQKADILEISELKLVRSLFCVVLSHYMCYVKGGWHQLEETVNFLLLNFEQGVVHPNRLRDLFDDIVSSLVEIPSDVNIFLSQPCRDNTLYFLKLVDEMLFSQCGEKLLFPCIGKPSDRAAEHLQPDVQRDIMLAVRDILIAEAGLYSERIQWTSDSFVGEDSVLEHEWWDFYDKIWVLINAMNDKVLNKVPQKGSSTGAPSFGQRARGLVESLNIPAAEMASAVSGGIGNALAGKTNKQVDKAMLLRGQKCPRIVFHLVILYLCKASLERASKCVQQFISLIPSFLASDDDQNRNRLHFLIWALLIIRAQYGSLHDGARFHVISHLIVGIINYGKSMIATSILAREDAQEFNVNAREEGSIISLIQKDRVLALVTDEVKHIRAAKADRRSQLQVLHLKLEDHFVTESNQRKAFERDIQLTSYSVLSSDDSRKAAIQLAYDEEQQIVADRWSHIFRSLVDERGPWSANQFPNDVVTHWKLDKTEDKWRRRPKLKRNYHFNDQLCYPPVTKTCTDIGNPASEYTSSISSHVPVQLKRFLLTGVRGIAEDGCSESTEEVCDDKDCRANSIHHMSSNIIKEHKGQMDVVLDKPGVSLSDSDTEPNEVQSCMPCIIVTTKRKLAGNLAVMHNILHFSFEFLVEGTGGSSTFRKFNELRSSNSLKPDQLGESHDKQYKGCMTTEKDCGKGVASGIIEKDVPLQNPLSKIKHHQRWNISKIKSVHWTRYLLQYTAIEIFFNDSTSPAFFNFASPKDAKHIGALIVSCRNELLFPKGSFRDKNGMITFTDRRIAIEMAENAREKWRRREMNNFEYLMILNTLSGRSYNDLTQYPVFPWVLSDYSSENLDFNKSSTFRDLSKPVGALDSKRFQVFEDRYRNFCDPDIPSFYYGSHYSSMGIVLFYLLRLDPFTALHRNLQGGKFDHADRLFQSIEGTYRNCLSNTSDVKELIPEFFYMPEFLVNSNSYHFGIKQDGEPLSDVTLPPWAKGSPEEFIYWNREALESEYVSSNLHQWIDLVFGYKQRGKPAVEAANVFYYLTYEGAVDLETMNDLQQRSAVEDQIANFGQTPIQLFRKKHPRRGPPVPIMHPLYFAPASISLTSIVSSSLNSPSSVAFINLLDSNIVVVHQGLTLSVKLWLTTQLQCGGNFTFSGSQDPFFGIGLDILPPCKIITPLAENVEFGRHCLAALQTPNGNYLISCGNWENSFQLISLNDGRIVQSIRQHKDVVSCVAVTSDGSILATGSYDTTIMVWHVFRGRSSEKRLRNALVDIPRRDHIIIENPFHILCGHDDIITCLFVSNELDLVISGSKDGTCIFHTLQDGRYVRSIKHPSGCALSKLLASRHGRIVIYAENDLTLHMYSINGKHIASSESNGRLNCIELSCCGNFLVCAGDHGQIIVRTMHSLEIVRKYGGVGKIITALTVTPEECFLAGTKDGSLLVYSLENPQIQKGTLTTDTKLKYSTTE